MNNPSTKNHFDVVILGAGPAGASCALALKDSNLKVALIDKSSFPRDKVCGDAIPGPCIKILQSLVHDTSVLKSFSAKQHVNRSVIIPGKGPSIKLDWKAEAYNSKRVDFDNYLYELVQSETNTTLIVDRDIKTLSRDDQVQLFDKNNEEVASCQVVLGADGANSLVARSFLKNQKAKLMNGFAIRAYYKNIDCPTDTNEFYLLNDIQGYFWIFPLTDNQFNIGIGFLKKQKKNKTFDVKKILADLIENHPTISLKFKDAQELSKPMGFKLPVGGISRQFSGDRFLLLGDAANLIDPLQGHGIDKAMESGIFAAQQVISCVKINRFDNQFLSSFDDQINKSIDHELKRNLRVMRILNRFPWVVQLSANIIKLNQTHLLKIFFGKK